MIREFQRDDINKVADIWLDTNIKAHNFIPAEYWKSNFKSVKEALLLAEVYVYEYDTEIQGFIGLNDEYVEGIFVSGEMQSQGIGKILLNYAKDKRNKLHLNVYQKNARAISFYKREGFEIQHSGLDEATGEKDYVMTWQHKQKYYSNSFKGYYEITSLTGTINTMNGEYYAHLHMSVGNEKGEAFGGHLNRAVVSATCEMVITVIDGNVDRVYDEETGLNVFKFDQMR